MTLTFIIRCLTLYFIVLILLRIMGKRQLGEMQPFELVITLIVADLATIPMSDTAQPLLHGIIPLFTLAVIHYFLSFLSRKSIFVRKLLNGSPVIIINPNGVDYKALRSLNMNFNDLIEGIRADGYFNLDEILYAIVQTNGSLIILPRAANSPVTAQMLNIDAPESSLPIIILSEGKPNKENLNLAKLDVTFLEDLLKKTEYKSLKELLLVTLTHSGDAYVMPIHGKFSVIKTNYNGEKNW